jgi:hypothetical protein
MAWRDMTAEEMIAATSSMDSSRKELNAEVLLAALMPRLFGAAEALVGYQQRVGEQTQQAQVLTRLCEVKDIRRDACHRAAYGLIGADRDVATTQEARAQAVEAQAALYPDGLALNQLSYQAQGGRDAMIGAALTPRLRAYLGGMRVTSHTALQLVEEAVALGPEIASLEIQRNGLLKAEDATAVSAGDVYALRLAWVQVMGAIEQLLPMTALSADQIEAAFGPARQIAVVAGQRAARNNK